MIASWFEDEPGEVYLSIHLNKLPLFKRVVNAIKYIFGYKSVFGDFEEIILSKNNIESVSKILNHLRNE